MVWEEGAREGSPYPDSRELGKGNTPSEAEQEVLQMIPEAYLMDLTMNEDGDGELPVFQVVVDTIADDDSGI